MTAEQLKKGKELEKNISHIEYQLCEWKKATGFDVKKIHLKGSWIDININDYISFKKIQENAINKLGEKLSALQKELDIL